jgi:predicted transcriptional regulator
MRWLMGVVLRLDEKLSKRIEEIAQASGVLPAELVREAVEEFAAHLNGEGAIRESDSVFELAAAAAAEFPEADWAALPRDLAQNFDHYHYGHPRED